MAYEKLVSNGVQLPKALLLSEKTKWNNKLDSHLTNRDKSFANKLNFRKAARVCLGSFCYQWCQRSFIYISKADPETVWKWFLADYDGGS